MATTDSPARRLLKQKDPEDQARLDAYLARSQSGEATGDPHDGKGCTGKICRHDTGHPTAASFGRYSTFEPKGGYWTYRLGEGEQFHGK